MTARILLSLNVNFFWPRSNSSRVTAGLEPTIEFLFGEGLACDRASPSNWICGQHLWLCALFITSHIVPTIFPEFKTGLSGRVPVGVEIEPAMVDDSLSNLSHEVGEVDGLGLRSTNRTPDVGGDFLNRMQIPHSNHA